MRDHIIYQFERERIEAMDSSHFLATFDINKLPTQEARHLFGRVHFMLGGYDCHPDELYVIPEVRRFTRQLHEQWPYWLYFCSLDDQSLKAFYVSLLDSVECIRLGDSGICHARFNIGELVEFLVADLTNADALCLRYGVKEGPRLQRATDVLRYFNLM